ncbi:MAG TPA: diguanylate cyclase, partial [Miltoncostaeaceae bacterium]|nr:diguanylate cyclase [Miltoncostaeaceae bacterium]
PMTRTSPPPPELDALPVAALHLGDDGVIRAANAPARAMWADPHLSGAVARLFPEEHDIAGRLAAVAGAQAPVRLQGARATGVPFTTDASVAAHPAGGLVVCLHEVRADRLVDATTGYLTAAFDASPLGAALFTTDGEYLRVNAELCRLLARTPDDLLGRRDQEFTHPDDRAADVDAAWRILRGEMDVWRTEKRFLTPSGGTVWVIANLVFIRDDAGRPLCWLGQFQDIGPRKRREERLAHLAEHDELTGAANRRGVMRALERRLADTAGGALLVLDLDGFKAVNDRYGHAAGDDLLVAVAAALHARLREGDVVGRLGGDEFAVILPGTGAEGARAIAAVLANAVARAARGAVTASCGIALYAEGAGSDPAALLARADAEMYRAKSARRAAAADRRAPAPRDVVRDHAVSG